MHKHWVSDVMVLEQWKSLLCRSMSVLVIAPRWGQTCRLSTLCSRCLSISKALLRPRIFDDMRSSLASSFTDHAEDALDVPEKCLCPPKEFNGTNSGPGWTVVFVAVRRPRTIRRRRAHGSLSYYIFSDSSRTTFWHFAHPAPRFPSPTQALADAR